MLPKRLLPTALSFHDGVDFFEGVQTDWTPESVRVEVHSSPASVGEVMSVGVDVGIEV